MTRFRAVALVLIALTSTALAADEVPRYELPANCDAAKLAQPLDDAARRAVATILDPPDADAAEDAVRVLAGLGRSALPHVVRGLDGAGWFARAGLVAAVAEMDCTDATPLLVAACRDPSFAVREAAVSGLGKTGDARGAAALAERANEASEQVWRVRAAAAAAIRRATLRGVMPRPAAEAALVRLIGDVDEDVRRAALREIAPLAADAALPAILDVFTAQKTAASDRTLALAALRAYRSPTPELLDALRSGFLNGGDDPEAAANATAEAGRALLAMRGVAALEDDQFAAAVAHRLHDSKFQALRDGIARLGRPAAPWLRAQALRLAERIAAAKENHGDTSFEEILDLIVQVDEAAALDLMKELLVAPGADNFHRETRLAVLAKVSVGFAPRMRAELRALFVAKEGADLRSDLLGAIVASGGDDLAGVLDAALANPDEKLRRKARELLKQRSDLPAGPHLLTLAKEAADADERRDALETLSRRDGALAARIAAGLLDDPHAEMRTKAITLLTASKDPQDFDRLVQRLEIEDGSDAPRAARKEGRPGAGSTPSEHVTDTVNSRRRLRHALVQAVRTTGGERARPVLLALVEKDPDEGMKRDAALLLRGIVRPEDAAKIVGAEAATKDADTRQELQCTLATLGDAPEAVARFEKLVGDSQTRSEALKLLKAPGSRVTTNGLAAGLAGREWTDDDRLAALEILGRAGKAPPPAELAALVVDARTLELSSEAARLLGTVEDEAATAELLTLMAKVTSSERLAPVVHAIAARQAVQAEGPLLDLFAAARERAMAATYASDPAVELYQECARAVADFGTDRAGEALAAHLLDARLAHSAARFAIWAGGPFQTSDGLPAPVAILQTLAGAFARRDEDSCRRFVAARLAALSADGREYALPETFLAGLARYLQDPVAYALAARPRPAAALELWNLVLRTAPRLTPFEDLAYEARDERLAEERNFRGAAQALTDCVALADVEDAARSREDRLVEQCRIAVRTAQALAAEGHEKDAMAIAAKLRDPDPTNGELAYRQGWLLARLGLAGPETEAPLRFAAAQDDKDARTHFQLGWITQTRSPEAAIPFFEQAVKLDRRRVEDRLGPDERTGYGGAAHEAGAYSYWYARTLRRTGDDALARRYLAECVALDDRLAATARADSVFAGMEHLEDVLQAGLDRIGRSQ